jgi:hypothetical protein
VCGKLVCRVHQAAQIGAVWRPKLLKQELRILNAGFESSSDLRPERLPKANQKILIFFL